VGAEAWCHVCVLKSTFCLGSSIGLPSKKVLVKWDPKTREINKFGKGTLAKKENNKEENQIEVLRQVHTLGVKF